MKEKRKNIAVIGAGISGLVCAYNLQKAGFSVTVYEKETTVGGRMRTRKKGEFPFDIGADHLSNVYKRMKVYCKELRVPLSNMRPLPYGLIQNKKIKLMEKGMSPPSKILLSIQWVLLRDKLDFFNLSSATKYDTDNAYNFMKKRTNEELADHYVDGFATAYNFHSAKEISSGALIAGLNSINHEKEDWPLMGTKGGMSALPNALARKLNIKTNTTIIEIKTKKNMIQIKTEETKRKFDIVVLATTANITKKIYKNPTVQQKSILDKTKYSTTISTAFRISVDAPPDFSVVWFPFIESKTISSFTNEAIKGKQFIKNGKSLISVWVHEAFAKKIMNKTDKEVFSIVKEELRKACPIFANTSLEDYDLQRWPQAIPKYTPGYLKIVKDFLESDQGNNNVYFCGDYLNSPWTEGALRCGERVAEQIIASYEPVE
jgi:protoporphyrinogen/coproporphyrinogen III oxidase